MNVYSANVLRQTASKVHDTDLNHCQASPVDEASAATNETKLSSGVEVHSSRQPDLVAVNALSAQSSRHLQAGTTDPPVDPIPANIIT